MPLQFIFGPSGSGKSHDLYQKIIQESMLHPERNYIVLVPEQFTMQTQKDLVSMHPNHGIMNIDILSFGRLAFRIFEETGRDTLPVLDDEGKNLILRKVAGNLENELCVLKGNMKKLGYISEVKSVISEFTQYDIGEEELEKMLAASGEGSRLYYKLKDIGVMYRGFTDYLDKKYITKEEILDKLSSVVKESEILKNSTIVLDGFTGFTPVQNRLLGQLMQQCRKVVVTVTLDPRENPYSFKHPYQLFGISKQMVASLTEIAKHQRIEIEEAIWQESCPPYRFVNNEAMAFLEQNLFRYGKRTYEKEQKSIGIFAARNPKEEALELAKHVRSLVRTRGLRYRDIGVIVSNMDTYGDYIRQAFQLYDIPLFMDHKRSILLNAFVEYIRSVLNMAEQNFSYESVFRFLKTGFSGFTWEQVDLLENYVLRMGIKGYKKWQEGWIRRPQGMTVEELELMNHLRVQLVEKTDDLMFVLKQRKKSVKDITLAVYEFMVQEDLQVKLMEQEKQFQEMGELALAKEYAQIYRVVLELLDKFVQLLGDEEVSLSEYCKLLDAGLEEARVGVIPPSIDQVTAGDVERTRLKDIKVLFLIGANDSHLPGSLTRNGLLSERDREKFQKENLTLSPGGKEKAYVQKFYLYMNLTKPSENLYVYYSKVSSEGRSLRPAYLVQEIRKLYPALSVADLEQRTFAQQEITEKTGISYLIHGLQNPWVMEEKTWQELYSWYKKQPEWQEKIRTLVKAGYYQCPKDGLSEKTALKLYGENFMDSISRMERFSACAFAHFLTYGLRLKERQEYDFQAMDMGNVCHKALECFAKKLKENEEEWTEISEEQRNVYIEESVEEAIVDYDNSVLYSSARNEYTIVRIKELMARTVWALTKQLSRGDFSPAEFEVKFESGKIDRIDVSEQGNQVYVKVLDYKTGSKKFDVVALYHGLQLQLMVYMDAAIKHEQKNYPGKEIHPAGIFYYQIKNPLVDKGGKDPVEHAILKELKPDGLIPFHEDVLKHLDNTQPDDSLVIPVRFNKDGSVSKNSKVVSEEAFHLMMNHAVRKVEEIHEEILKGNTEISPYRRGTETGCDYCKYKQICGFDAKVSGYNYRDLENLDQDQIIMKMALEQEGKGD